MASAAFLNELDDAPGGFDAFGCVGHQRHADATPARIDPLRIACQVTPWQNRHIVLTVERAVCGARAKPSSSPFQSAGKPAHR